MISPPNYSSINQSYEFITKKNKTMTDVNDSEVMVNMIESNTQQNDESAIDDVYDSIANVGMNWIFFYGEPDTYVNEELGVDDLYNSDINGGNQGLEMIGADEGVHQVQKLLLI